MEDLENKISYSPDSSTAEKVSPDKELIPVRLKFSLAEFSGSLGDLGLFLPLVVAMAIGAVAWAVNWGLKRLSQPPT